MQRTVWPFVHRPRWWWRWRIAGFLAFFAALTFTSLIWDGPLAGELAVLLAGGAAHVALLVASDRRLRREQPTAQR
ncbi:hypothetical protein GCM10027174_42100 [Salinifilum aidingensis]